MSNNYIESQKMEQNISKIQLFLFVFRYLIILGVYKNKYTAMSNQYSRTQNLLKIQNYDQKLLYQETINLEDKKIKKYKQSPQKTYLRQNFGINQIANSSKHQQTATSEIHSFASLQMFKMREQGAIYRNERRIQQLEKLVQVKNQKIMSLQSTVRLLIQEKERAKYKNLIYQNALIQSQSQALFLQRQVQSYKNSNVKLSKSNEAFSIKNKLLEQQSTKLSQINKQLQEEVLSHKSSHKSQQKHQLCTQIIDKILCHYSGMVLNCTKNKGAQNKQRINRCVANIKSNLLGDITKENVLRISKQLDSLDIPLQFDEKQIQELRSSIPKFEQIIDILTESLKQSQQYIFELQKQRSETFSKLIASAV